MLPTQEIPIVPQPSLINVISIKDPVVTVMPMYNSANYYHWLCEGLARLLWLKEHILDRGAQAVGGAGAGKREGRRGDQYKVLIPGPNIRHIEQTLSLLGIPASRRLYYPPKMQPNTIYAFEEELAYVDWVIPEEDTHGTLATDPWAPVFQPREALERVRDFFHAAVDANTPDHKNLPWQIVYVSRKNAVRMVHNEDEVIETLREKFGDGRVVVHTGTASVLDQAGMFKRARVVVGAHGAGLSNLVHCNPGAGLVMLPMAPHSDHTFSHMTSALKVKTWIVSEVSSNYYNHYGVLTTAQIDLIVLATEQAVEATAPKPSISISSGSGRGSGSGGKDTRKHSEL